MEPFFSDGGMNDVFNAQGLITYLEQPEKLSRNFKYCGNIWIESSN